MSVIAEIEKLAFALPEAERARLADRLLESLPKDCIDQEELELLMRRDGQMDEDPAKVISLADLDRKIAERFPIVPDEM